MHIYQATYQVLKEKNQIITLDEIYDVIAKKVLSHDKF